MNLPIYAPLPLNVSSITTSTLTANKITANSTISGFFEGTYGEISNWYVDEKLYVNFQELTADSDQLFLNGIPVATTANLSSIQNWSYFAQVSTLDGNNQSTIGLSYLEASTIGTKNLIASNIFTQNLMAFNIVNFTSSVIEVYESTIQSDIKLANISTANINNLYVSTGGFSTLNSINGAFNNISAGTASINTLTGTSASFSNFTASSITVSSIISPPAASAIFSSITVVSNTNTGSLTVGSNDTTSFSAAPNFNAGANFYGTRPNFTTGIDSAGANNFNNCNLDNVGRITANTVFVGSPNYVNIQTSSFTAILNNRGADVGGNSVIDLKSRFGAATRVNITADASSALAPTPTQIVTITANGATSLTQNAVGGKVSIVANAGSGSGANILGFGEIDMIAYSSAPYPGVIKESAGSILAYSGVTVPAVGVPGCSFYSALTCLSLTAGATPATTSFPGVVFLRGDNGTKVTNGFYSDTIEATGNSILNTITTNGLTAFTGSSLAFFATSQNIQFNSATVGFNAVITGPLSVSSITNVSTINGQPYTPGGGGGASTISTFTTLQTSSFTVSSINGSAYPPASVSSWVSTATTPLFLSDYYIDLRPAGYSGNGLSWGSVAPYSVGIDGPFLFGYTQGALGTTSNANDISLAWDKNKIEMYKPIDLNGNNISSISTATASFLIGTKGNASASIIPTVSPLSVQNGGFNTTTRPQIEFQYNDGGGYNHYIVSQHDNTTAGSNSIDFFINTFGGGQSGSSAPGTGNTQALSIRGDEVSLFKPLDMNGFVITDATSTLTISSINVNIGGPGTVALAAGDLSTNYASLALFSTSVFLAQVGDTAGVIDINAAGNIQTAAVSTINTVQNTYFTGGISKRLDGVGILQPIIQYGQVSSSGSSGSVVVTIPYQYTAVNTYLPFACMADAPAAEIYVSTQTNNTFEIGWQNGGGGNQLFNWHTMGN